MFKCKNFAYYGELQECLASCKSVVNSTDEQARSAVSIQDNKLLYKGDNSVFPLWFDPCYFTLRLQRKRRYPFRWQLFPLSNYFHYRRIYISIFQESIFAEDFNCPGSTPINNNNRILYDTNETNVSFSSYFIKYSGSERECFPCHELCSVGCMGPKETECYECKYAKIRKYIPRVGGDGEFLMN